MAKPKLVLEVVGQPNLVCDLRTTAGQLTAKEVLTSDKAILADQPYQFVVDFDEVFDCNQRPSILALEINGARVNFELRTEEEKYRLIPLADYDGHYYGVYKPFSDCFGFVQSCKLVYILLLNFGCHFRLLHIKPHLHNLAQVNLINHWY